MSYQHIENLYKMPHLIGKYEDVYAMEKIHGTSTHIAWRPSETGLTFFAGGLKHEDFVGLFDEVALREGFARLQSPGAPVNVIVYGEGYGGKCQGMAHTYGPSFRFVAFEVKMAETWFTVPEAEAFCQCLGLDFVPYRRVPCTLEALNVERDAPSVQARKNGIEGDHPREGIVIRPLVEAVERGHRVMAKHKRAEFCETKTPREVDPAKLATLADARSVAEEWVTPTRLDHVLDGLSAAGTPATDMQHTSAVIRAMLEDVRREAAGEIEWSKEAERAVCTAAAKLYKARVTQVVG